MPVNSNRSPMVAGSLLMMLLLMTGCAGETEAPSGQTEAPTEAPPDETEATDEEAPTGSALGDVAGRYAMTGVGPTQSLVMHADGNYELTFHGSPMMAGTETGTVTRDGEQLEFAGQSTRTPLGSAQHRVYELADRTVLVPTRFQAPYELSPTWSLGLVRLEEGEERPGGAPPNATSNPAGPDGELTLPVSLTVSVQRPSDARFLRFTVRSAPTNASSEGCVSASADGECSESHSSTWGPEAWAELNQRWWPVHTQRQCADVQPDADAPRYRISWEGGELAGRLPDDLSEAGLADPCASEARFAWWLAERFEGTLPADAPVP